MAFRALGMEFVIVACIACCRLSCRTRDVASAEVEIQRDPLAANLVAFVGFDR